MKQGIDPITHKPVTSNSYVKDKKIDFLEKGSDYFPSSSSSMPVAVELEHGFHVKNGGLMLSSSIENGSIRDPLFWVKFQSAATDPVTYNSNLLAQYHQTNYETSLPNLASLDHQNADFSDVSGSKMNTNSFNMNEARESSSTTNSSNMTTSLSGGFQPMAFEGEMFQLNVKSEQGCVGQWQHHQLHDVQVDNASDFNIYSMGSLPGAYTDVFHQI